MPATWGVTCGGIGETQSSQTFLPKTASLPLARIRQAAIGRGKTELPTADFSNALNSVWERLIYLLLQNEYTGNW